MWEIVSLEHGEPARVVGHSLAPPVVGLIFTLESPRPRCIPEKYIYPPPSLRRLLQVATLTLLEKFPDKTFGITSEYVQLDGASRLTFNNSAYASVHSRNV